MKKLFRTACILFLASAATHAAVVRPAPNFAVADAARGATLKSFRGQPVVIVFARHARDGALRKELSRLEKLYAQFATEKVVFIAVVQEDADGLRSNIPFSTAADPAQVAADYGVNGSFAIGVVGKDGNLDLITDRVIPASRVSDAIFNSYENQAPERASS